MTYAKRVDVNQNEIVLALRAVGVEVFISSGIGHGFPDLVCDFYGKLLLIEVKDGSKPPSKRKLTRAEDDFYGKWHLHMSIVGSVSEALGLARLYRGDPANVLELPKLYPYPS